IAKISGPTLSFWDIQSKIDPSGETFVDTIREHHRRRKQHIRIVEVAKVTPPVSGIQLEPAPNVLSKTYLVCRCFLGQYSGAAARFADKRRKTSRLFGIR